MKTRLLLTLALPVFSLAGLSTSASAQQEIDAPDGPWTHRVAKAVFPQYAGGFVRTRVTEFNASGDDVGVGYGLERGDDELFITVYLYPAEQGRSCRTEMDDTKAPIVRYEGETELFDRPAPPVPAQSSGEAYHARYTIPANGMRPGSPAFVSDAYLHCPAGGEWMVKVRASWTGEAETFPDLSPLLNAIGWSHMDTGPAA
ncbi:hypothetical protein [Qipengyuania sp. JC766]|uniref:hypothetical protein n=1 Tax=Qipengyuania sp. JC766 TaxID=3232139 RepID=UPI00345A0700